VSPRAAAADYSTLITSNNQSKTLDSYEDVAGDSTVRRNLNVSLQDVSQASIKQSNMSLASSRRANGEMTLLSNMATMKSKTALALGHKRSKSNVHASRYAHIATENLKFEAFMEALFASKMTREDVKDEVKAYVQVLETNYTDTIRELKA
jgi:hypothetical protein